MNSLWIYLFLFVFWFAHPGDFPLRPNFLPFSIWFFWPTKGIIKESAQRIQKLRRFFDIFCRTWTEQIWMCGCFCAFSEGPCFVPPPGQKSLLLVQTNKNLKSQAEQKEVQKWQKNLLLKHLNSLPFVANDWDSFYLQFDDVTNRKV